MLYFLLSQNETAVEQIKNKNKPYFQQNVASELSKLYYWLFHHVYICSRLCKRNPIHSKTPAFLLSFIIVIIIPIEKAYIRHCLSFNTIESPASTTLYLYFSRGNRSLFCFFFSFPLWQAVWQIPLGTSMLLTKQYLSLHVLSFLSNAYDNQAILKNMKNKKKLMT